MKLRSQPFLNAAKWLTKYHVNQYVQLKLVNPILLGGNSIFLGPFWHEFDTSLRLATPRVAWISQLLCSVSILSPQGPQKMNFLPRKMDPPVFVTYWLTNTHL